MIPNLKRAFLTTFSNGFSSVTSLHLKYDSSQAPGTRLILYTAPAVWLITHKTSQKLPLTMEIYDKTSYLTQTSYNERKLKISKLSIGNCIIESRHDAL
jgi:hypothetical protein